METEKGPVITIGGPHGSGRSTIAKAVAEHFKLRIFSTGKAFRELGEDRGLSVVEFNKTAEREVDLEIDNQSKEEAAKGGVVIESDIAAWINPDADCKIWLAAGLEVRAERIFTDEKTRISEKYPTLEAAKKEIAERDEADKNRYKTVYEIDLDDMSIYDLVFDTENLSVEEVINKVVEYIEQGVGG